MRLHALLVVSACVAATQCATVRASDEKRNDIDLGKIQEVMQDVADKMKESTEKAASAVSQTSEQVKQAMEKLQQELKEHQKPIGDTIAQAAQDIGETVKEGAAQIGDTIAEAAAAIKAELEHEHQAGANGNQAEARECRKACPKVYAPVCGTDAKTYSNRCEMDRITCEGGYLAEVKHTGACDPNTDHPMIPEKVTDPCWKACTRELRPVCGNNGVTYGNKCVFEVKQCRMGGEGMLSLAHTGKCEESEEKPDTSACVKACTRDYRPVCGSDGKTYSNPCVMEIAQCVAKVLGKEPLTLAREGACEATKIGINKDCPLFCTLDYTPVCGNNGKTYGNKCGLLADACKHPEEKIAVAHDGECEATNAPEHHHNGHDEDDDEMWWPWLLVSSLICFAALALAADRIRRRRLSAARESLLSDPDASSVDVDSEHSPSKIAAMFARRGAPPAYTRVLADDTLEEDPDELFAPEYTAADITQGYVPVSTSANEAEAGATPRSKH